jgi:hypothetical protein
MGLRSVDWCVVTTQSQSFTVQLTLIAAACIAPVLTEMASISERSELVKEQREEKTKALVQKYLPLRLHNAEDIKKDVTSHYILRLAYCLPYDIVTALSHCTHTHTQGRKY